MDKNRRDLIGLAGAATIDSSLTTFAGRSVHAAQADYPNKPIKLIVPFPPGGGTDLIGRFLAKQLSVALNQSVIVDNRSGAGGMIGSQACAAAPADGYTISVGITGTHALPVAMGVKQTYDPIGDFTAISLLGYSPNFLLVHPSFPARTVAEFIEVVRAHPGVYSFGSWGNGSGGHFAGEYLKKIAKLDMQHVPYKGVAPMINDLVGGQIVVAFGDGGASPPQVKAGKIIALAAAGTRRSPALPDISTFDEQGIKFIADSWYGIFGPTRLPAEIVGRLSDEFRKILAQADSLSMLASFGLVAQAAGPAEFKQLVQRDIELWTKVARDANIQSES